MISQLDCVKGTLSVSTKNSLMHWADAGVGILISLSIINDGFSNLKQSVWDLLDEIPKSLGTNKIDPLMKEVEKIVKQQDWISSLKLRFRDEGHVFLGDIFIVPKENSVSVEKIAQLQNEIRNHNWRLHDIAIMPVLGK
ncbi:TPA: hypothetical protein ACPSKE_003020 [Legionella feeleii]